MATELTPDQKGQASLTLGEVIRQTRQNFPDPRYRPIIHAETPYYHLYGLNPYPHQVWPTADGIGTKPELAERMVEWDQEPRYFESLAFDTFAMIDGDVARFGYFLPGIANVIDVNTATPEVITALARGAKRACDAGKFAMYNGETAELGYRVSGYGRTRVNWNAFGLMLIANNKVILGENLHSGQPLVAVREKSIRSNGLSKARAIAEAVYLSREGYRSKEQYFTERLNEKFSIEDLGYGNVTRGRNQDSRALIGFINHLLGHDFLEQVLVPWHKLEPELTRALLTPSTLYGPLMYAAQGGVNGPREVDITAAAHISGGGIPEKVKRMVEPRGLGAHIDNVFPDPASITCLLELNTTLEKPLVTDRTACEQWNRGIGFVVATKTKRDANKLIRVAEDLGYDAAIAGEITHRPQIQFRGHTWIY